jgi:dCMP deaminase
MTKTFNLDDKQTDRISWEVYALKLAQVASLRSPDPYKKVGACALDFNNRVIGCSYNGLKSGLEASKEFWLDRDKRRPYVIHAETNLLSLFKRGECKILACTLLPCRCCANSIVAHDIKKIVYIENYEQDSEALNIFKFNNIDFEQIFI